MLAKVHIAAKELALDPETYGAVLMRTTGEASAAGLSDEQLHRVLAEFRRLGWRPKPAVSPKPGVRLVYALWKALGPHLSDGSPEALRSFVRRQTKSALHPDGLDAPEFLNPAQCNKVVEGLKAWFAREKGRVGRRGASAAGGEARP